MTPPMVLAQGSFTDGLVAHYRFTGNSQDSSGLSNHLSVVGATLAVDRLGQPNACYYFDGTSAWMVSQADIPISNSLPRTISVWFRNDDPSFYTGVPTLVGLGRMDTVGDLFDLKISGKNEVYLHNHSQGSVSQSNVFATGVWNHLVITSQGSVGSTRAYIAGVEVPLQTEAAPNAPLLTTPSKLRISTALELGGISNESVFWWRQGFKGWIDDVRVYNRALSGEEVGQLHELERPKLTEGLVAHYPLDRNSNDLSGEGNHGVPHKVTFSAISNRLAATFTGEVDSRIAVSNSPSLHMTNAVTVSLWFNSFGPLNGPMCMLDKAWKQPTAGDWSYRAWSAWLSGGWATFEGVPDNLPGPGPEIGVTPVLDHQWYHLVGVGDGSRGLWQIYTNGVLGHERLVTPFSLSTGAFPLIIGAPVAQTDGAQTGFHGAIDDVRIYKRALSPPEIASLYAMESAPQPCIPRAAAGVPIVVNGFVVAANLTDGGCGYSNAPIILIKGEGTGATATATVRNGVVTSIQIINAGSGYGTNTAIKIASPPFMPWLEIAVSKVTVSLHLVLGRNYVLLSSTDLVSWSQVGPKFTAEDEVLTQEFAVDTYGRYFRVQEVP